MKQFDNIVPSPEQIKIVNQRQVEDEKKLYHSTSMHNGHTMYEIDCSSGEIREATYKTERIEFVPEIDIVTMRPTGKQLPKTVRDINCKDNCVYIAALNKKSANKKYIKWATARIMGNINRQIKEKTEP
jgi:hypothetical protein